MSALPELSPKLQTIIIADDETGQRLDKVLSARLPDLSRSRVQELMREGHVSGPQGLAIDNSFRVKTGEAYEVQVPPAVDEGPTAEDLPLKIVFEDADVIVIDKPAGQVVHPSAGHAGGTLVNALMSHCQSSLSGIGGVLRPGIVHRLDKDTSGLLVVAKNDAAHQSLSAQFAAHGADGQLQRAYIALVWGQMLRRSGTIDVPLARSNSNRTKIAVTTPQSQYGRHAVTHFQVLDTFLAANGKAVTMVKLQLETGRTHQIRVHLAHIGHPILADATYGAGFKTSETALTPKARAALASLGRQALHAAILGFTHPRTGKACLFESPLPADLQALIAALKSS
jgi:23S rRNA pseudouridine1911/1915/1917 synthase